MATTQSNATLAFRNTFDSPYTQLETIISIFLLIIAKSSSRLPN